VAEEAAEHLGIAMTGVINLMNPAMVVVGGGLARLGDLILHKVREMAQGRTLMHSLTASKIRVSDLGPQSIAVGAATLVLKAALEDSRLFPDPADVMERQH
jgi:predicted NBD/HSP70 family sugar kinase